MTMTDPIADMLTRIRNASMARKDEVLVPYSKIKLAIAKILEKEKFIERAAVVEDNFKFIKIQLRYLNKKSAISSIRRISKTGRKIYAGKDKLPRVLNDFGIAIITTSKGVMTNKEARRAGLGGEVICEIY